MISKKEGMKVRQSYKRTIKKLMMEQRFRNHPKNRKRAMRSERKLKTIAGRLLRELQRNLSSVAYKKYEEKLRVFDRVINQKKDDKNKLYSLHELEVYCISKGKEHKKYEFGSKASIITTKKSGIIIGAMNVKNEYDGHILPSILKQSKELRGVELDKLIVDRGFKGIAKVGSTIIQRPEKPKKSDSQYQKQKKRKDFGRRAAIEPIISHLKTDFLLSRNYLKGSVGDSINLMLSCAAFNYRKFIRRLEFIFAIFRNIIKWNFEVLNLNFKTF
jgi:IS5 family transposase